MRTRLLAIILAVPAAMLLLIALAHIGPSAAEASPRNHGGLPSLLGLHRQGNKQPPSFGERIAGTYLMSFVTKGKALVILHADGGYTAYNAQSVATEYGNWTQDGRRRIKGTGLIFMPAPPASEPNADAQEGPPNPELNLTYARDRWTMEFNDSLDGFDFLAEVDMIPGTEDPLDPNVVGTPFPLPPGVVLAAEGRRIPAEIN